MKVLYKYEVIITITELLKFFSNKLNNNPFSVYFGGHYSNNPDHVNLLWEDVVQFLTLKCIFTKQFPFPSTLIKPVECKTVKFRKNNDILCGCIIDCPKSLNLLADQHICMLFYNVKNSEVYDSILITQEFYKTGKI